jgi:hypothetical protein
MVHEHDGRFWPKHVARKHFHVYCILIIINSDELCCTRDCFLKEIIRKTCNGMLRYNMHEQLY